MKRAIRFLCLAMSLIGGLPGPAWANELTDGSRPNVVFILADDLGWSDTTLYGTTKFYQTPNIQRLAQRGMTFTHAYSASPLCSPTRASILTGLAPARHGITSPNCHLPKVNLQAKPGTTAAANQKSVQPESVSRLSPEYPTIAKTLHAAGYATGHFGKWHLGAEPYSALQHGFDVDIPHWPGPGPAGSYVAPWKFPDFDPDPGVPNQHLEDRMAKEAVQFIREHREQPFFLNYWMFSVHAPFDAKQALIDKYRSTVDDDDEQRCPTYAAMIESMDQAVGTLLDALDEWKLSDNTIIVFASDNGGNMYNEVDGERPTSNRPLRGGKATMYEGGVRTPAIIVWPKHVQPGSESSAVVQSMDYYPTLLDMLDLQPAAGQVIDGMSLLPALRGEALTRDGIFTYFPHSPLVPEWMPPAISVHAENWKLIRIFFGGENGQHRYKLFDLALDPGEQTNLAERYPEKVTQLDALIERHLRDTAAVTPVPNPAFDPLKYDPSREGIPAPRRAAGRQATPPQGQGQSVAGWRPMKNCRLALDGERLSITCLGPDPHFSHVLQQPLPAGNYQFCLRLTSSVADRAQIFWSEVAVSPKFKADRSVGFAIAAGDTAQDYTAAFTAASEVTEIRIDPLSGPGDVQLSFFKIIDSQGKVVAETMFGAPTP